MSIQTRLASVLWTAALLALLLGAAGLAIYQRLTLEQRVRQIIEPYARFVAVGSDAAIAFQDPNRAQEILETLHANPDILGAEIVLQNGERLAGFAVGEAPHVALPSNGLHLNGQHAQLRLALSHGAHLQLHMSLRQLENQTAQLAWLFATGLLVMLSATAIQLHVLKCTVAEPIAKLTAATETIQAAANYRHRVQTGGSDELSRLARSFNAMMDAIEEREAELLKLSNFRRTILDNVAYGIVTTDAEGIVTSFNPAAERLLGYRADEVIGRTTPLLWHDPDEIARYAASLSDELGYPVTPGFTTFSTRPLHRQSEEHEWTFIGKNGQRFPVNLCITALLNPDGSVGGFVGLVYDLTERKQTQHQLNLLSFALDKVRETILLTGEKDPRFLYVNQSTADTLGYSRDELTGNMGIADIDPKWQTERWQNFWQDLSFKRQMQFESVHRTRSGKQFPVEVTCNYFEYDGSVYNLAICRDISERKHAEAERSRYKDLLEETVQRRTEQLRLACDAAEAANKAKSTFLANMNHELRTPLNAILGFSSLLLSNAEIQGDERCNLEIIQHSGEHLLTLINNVLEMAKIEAGRTQLEQVPYDLPAMVEQVANMMRIRALDKKLQLIVEPAADIPRYLVGDEARLRQVLINLVGNAIKFTEHGQIIIRIATALGKIPTLTFEVEDSGPGIPAQARQRIFEPFVQLNPTANAKGTGLGLSISRQFVQLMNGKISLESTVGKGSLFRIEIPLQLASKSEFQRSRKFDERTVIGLAPGQKPLRILIAEDQPENRLLLMQLMKKIGLDVRAVENGEKAVALFESWQPDFIWMDRQMPILDGLQAAKIIRKLPGGNKVKIVAVSASAFAEQRAEMLAGGIDDFVGKPFQSNELYACLGKQLGVSFLYADYPDAAAAEPGLSADMLTDLDEAFRTELEAALISLDGARIEQAIARIQEQNRTLAQILTKLAADLNYPAILTALRAIS